VETVDSLPYNYEPEGRVFESLRAHHKSLSDDGHSRKPFREGMSSESMVQWYPALTLEQVHGALAFYLANHREIDAYVMEGHRAAESQHEQSRKTNAELIAKLQRARNASQISG
jgi:hypothetical protein